MTWPGIFGMGTLVHHMKAREFIILSRMMTREERKSMEIEIEMEMEMMMDIRATMETWRHVDNGH